MAAIVDAPAGHVTLGAFMANGIEQKQIDSLQQCLKQCSAAGLGIPATVRQHHVIHSKQMHILTDYSKLI